MLDSASVSPEVIALRPDYRALLIVAEGLVGNLSAIAVDELVDAAEKHAREAIGSGSVGDIPHVAAWRDAYRDFGAKPQKFRSSVESLLRRAESGLPRINPLTDLYNALSVLHQVPIGGEDLDHYVGAPRLIRASGQESFDTVADGEDIVDHPEPGEVVWVDDRGVTCRMWNWRQCRRTRLTEETTNALFIVDALAPVSNENLAEIESSFTGYLQQLYPGAPISQRLIRLL